MTNRALQPKSEDGFTLMELVVTMVLTVVVLTAAFALMRGAMNTANTSYEMTSAQQSVRNAQEFLARELLTAGDGLKGISTIWIPTSFATQELSSRSTSDMDPGATGYCSPGLIISDDDVPTNTNVDHGTIPMKILGNTDRITMLGEDRTFSNIDLTTSDVSDSNGYVRVPAARLPDFQVNEVYFLTNGIAGTFFAITSIDTGTRRLYADDGDTLGLNRTGGTGNLASIDNAGLPMILKRVKITQFFVEENNKLMRR
ncbi:MAG: prepilin-type N-terminal cleavage/methylation domain-containing protein, partial [Acidobacteriota bacterium]|nr:prepilin-type N-terminal cleavage/methylation domain-containing protein [Acidobacteriota bacterium]